MCNKFYIMPKVHKQPPSLRPITAAHSFYLKGIANFLALHLRDLFLGPMMSDSVIRDTPHFLGSLWQSASLISEFSMICVVDVEAMYPSIDRAHAI